MKNKTKEIILKITVIITFIFAINMLILPIISAFLNINIGDDALAKYRFFPLFFFGFLLILEVLFFSKNHTERKEIIKYKFYSDHINDLMIEYLENIGYCDLNVKSDIFNKIYLKKDKSKIKLYSILKPDKISNQKSLNDARNEFKQLIEKEYNISKIRSVCIVNIIPSLKSNIKLKTLTRKSVIQNIGFLDIPILLDLAAKEVYIPKVIDSIFNISHSLYKEELKELKNMLSKNE